MITKSLERGKLQFYELISLPKSAAIGITWAFSIGIQSQADVRLSFRHCSNETNELKHLLF